MSAVIIIGAGPSLGAALAAVLRDSGVFVLVAERVTKEVEVLDPPTIIMREVQQIGARPLPPLVLNLPKRSSWQVPGPGRTGKRHREQRTKRGR